MPRIWRFRVKKSILWKFEIRNKYIKERLLLLEPPPPPLKVALDDHWGESVGGVQHLKEVHCFLLSLNFFYCCHPADQEQLNGRQAKLVRNTIVPASIRANFLYFSLFSQTLRNLLIFSILWIFRLEFDDLGLKKPLYASTKDPQGLFFSCHSNLLWRLEFEDLGLKRSLFMLRLRILRVSFLVVTVTYCDN